MTIDFITTASAPLASATAVDANFATVKEYLDELDTLPSAPLMYCNVHSYGAVGDGVTDDTDAIILALDDSRYYGNAVFFPSGTYLTNTIILEHKDKLLGESRHNTIIKQIGNNETVIQGKDAYIKFATPTFDNSDGANEVFIQGLTIDGNRAVNTTSGDGIAIYGYGTKIKDVLIRNTRHDGLRTEWTDGSVSMEGTFSDLVIDTCGYHGWRFKGPHDAHISNVMVIDASQEMDNGFSGIVVSSGNARFFNIHVWHRSGTTNRCYAAFQSSGGCEVVASHFEGCRQQQVRHNGSTDRFIGCLFYAPFGANDTALVVVNGNDNQHIGCRYLAGNGVETNNNVYAIQFGDSVGVAGNMIVEGSFGSFVTKSPFNFYNSLGLNRVTGRGFAEPGGATSFSGTVNATDEIDYVQGGTVINYRKPRAHPVYSSNTAAASGGVPVGGVYVLSSNNTLTVRV